MEVGFKIRRLACVISSYW